MHLLGPGQLFKGNLTMKKWLLIIVLMACNSLVFGQFGGYKFGSRPFGGVLDTTLTTPSEPDSFECPISDSMLIGYWAFDVEDSLVYDSTYNDYTGVLNGGSWITGKRGKALSFNGTSSNWVNFGDNMDLGTGDFTFCFWARFTDFSANYIIASKYNSNGWYVASNTSGRIYAKIRDASTNVNVTNDNVSMNVNTWYFIVLKRDADDGSTGMKILVNNANEKTGQQGTGTISNGDNMYFGQMMNLYYGKVQMDECWLFQRLLSTDELNILMNRVD